MLLLLIWIGWMIVLFDILCCSGDVTMLLWFNCGFVFVGLWWRYCLLLWLYCGSLWIDYCATDWFGFWCLFLFVLLLVSLFYWLICLCLYCYRLIVICFEFEFLNVVCVKSLIVVLVVVNLSFYYWLRFDGV